MLKNNRSVDSPQASRWVDDSHKGLSAESVFSFAGKQNSDSACIKDLATGKLFTWKEVFSLSDVAIKSLKKQVGDSCSRVLLLCDPSPKQIVLELSLMRLGWPYLSIHPYLSSSDWPQILADFNPEAMISDRTDFLALNPCLHLNSDLRSDSNFSSNFDEPSQVGTVSPRKLSLRECFDFQSTISAGSEETTQQKNWYSDQPFSFSLTTGSEGQPKVVAISLQSIHEQLLDSDRVFSFSSQDRCLHILPFSHIMGKLELWLHWRHGFSLTLVTETRKLEEAFRRTHPTLMLSVPRTYERLYAQLLSPLEAHPLYRGSLSLFKKHSKNIVTRKMSGQALNLATYMMDRLLEKSIYKRVRDYLGGKMRLMICGGAALPPEVSSFFIVCGLNLIEGYGLTETTGPCFTNTPFDFRIGSVGKFHGQFRGPYSSRVQGSPPLFRLSPVSEMAAVKDETSGESFTPGQIEISGPKLALGYWRKGKLYPLRSPDGFFITSDLGYLKDGYLHLVGRRDNLIKLTSGKFLSIEKLEKKLSGLAGIQACFVFGEGKTYPVVLFFTPGPIKTFDWSSFRESLSKLNSELGTHESIRKYRVLEMRSLLEAMGPNWEQSKIGRRQVYEKFRDLIEDL